MVVLSILGGISLILGIFLMMSEDNVKKLEDALNKQIVKSDGVARKHGKALGMVLLILGAVLLYLGITIKR